MTTAALIPVRLGSSRLPKKAVLDLCGKPVIEHLIDRLKLAKSLDSIVICTTLLPIDDPLVEIAARNGVHLFRGSEEDILQRMLQAALKHRVDLAITCEGDDPLVDPDQVDAVATALSQSDAVFVKFEGLPFGTSPTGIKVEALEEVCELKDETDTATGWGRYFTESGMFKVEILKVEDPDLRHPEIRLTLDYPEDYEFIKAVFAELYRSAAPVRLRDVIRLVVNRPDIAALNSGLEERYWAHFHSAMPPATNLRRRSGEF